MIYKHTLGLMTSALITTAIKSTHQGVNADRIENTGSISTLINISADLVQKGLKRQCK